MTDELRDPFDDRLASLLDGYGDQALASFDPRSVAGNAVRSARRRPRRDGPGWRVRATLLLAAAVAVVGALGGSLLLAGSPPAPTPQLAPSVSATLPPSTVVIDANGPSPLVVHVKRNGEVFVENRTDVRWVPWGITEKSFNCRLVAGSPASCAVAPHSTMAYRMREPAPRTELETRFAPDGVAARDGTLVLVVIDAP